MQINSNYSPAAPLSDSSRPERHAPRDDSSRKRAGWISPVYTSTRCIRPDSAKAEQNHCLAADSSEEVQKQYDFIRSRIRQRIGDSAGKTIMVTSPQSGEGKTITAVNLALTLARDYEHTVLLVDADLKGQRIHEVVGYESAAGLADNLLDDRPLHELMVSPGVEKLTIISGGGSLLESSELLRSSRMGRLVSEMRDRYPDRYVLFDVPPVLTGTEAVSLASSVDYIIVTVRAGVSTLPDLQQALDLLPQDKIIGVILNGVDNG
jgi:non-specific protein-tyrosine kinase